MATYGGTSGDDFTSGTNSDDTIYGGSGGNDTLIGNDGNDDIWSSNTDTDTGSDTIYGGLGDDTASGGLGADLIFGELGNDWLLGARTADLADANDTIYGGAGFDTIEGQAGDDVAYGGDDDDWLFGDGPEGYGYPSGNDQLYGDAGNDRIYGDEGNDTLDGGIGNDQLFGGLGSDLLYGGDGNDTMDGGDGNDYVSGGTGSDLVDGGTGNDTLDGSGDGADTLTGGLGDDLFIISGGAGDSVFLSDFGAGETDGVNGDPLDNDYVDLTPWYDDTTLAQYNTQYGTDFSTALGALQHDALDGTLDFIALQGGPDVTFSLVGSGVMDTEHTGVVCFARGTMIETECGPTAIEDLQRGDRVKTMDKGFQPIRWIGARRILADELEANPKLRPIRIRSGALGAGLPVEDVLVSPQHRVLVSSRIAERMFDEREILVPAKQLLLLDGIDIAEDVDAIEYFHFLFDDHQVVFAEGAPMESLFTGMEALKAVSPEARREIFEIMPELVHLTAETLPEPARPIRRGRVVRKLVSRHAQNGVALLG